MELILKILTQARTGAGDEGQSLVEYALLILLIAIASIVALMALGQTVLTELYQPIEDYILPILGMA